MNNKLAKRSMNCRECGHPRGDHALNVIVNEGMYAINDLMLILEDIPCVGGGTSALNSAGFSFCGCRNWIPLDNLEYLKWKHERNEGKNESL